MENIKQKFEELQFISGTSDKNNAILDCILLIHSINLTNDLICTGVQEDDPEIQVGEGSEEILVPQGWDISQDSIYSLRYGLNKSDEKIYFKFIHENDILDVNAVSSINPGKIISMQINLTSFLNQNKNNNNKFNQSIVNEYNKLILEKIKANEKEQQQQKAKQQQEKQEEQNKNKFKFFFDVPQQQQQKPIFSDFGSSDLNPLQGSIGGMGGNLMGPQQLQGYYQQQQQQQQQGLQISRPKIRYDPYGPEDIMGPNVPGGRQDGFRDLYGNQGGFGIGGGGGMGGGLGGLGGQGGMGGGFGGGQGGQGGGGFFKGGNGGGGFGGFGGNKGGFF